jgi:CHAT domain-containing protein
MPIQERLKRKTCCHGTFDPQDFLQSALCLAHEERVTMSEMLNHHADLRGLRLLLLSACQTALLDLQGAHDEGHSLAVAMVQAGAQAVLAAQWAVDDKATYLLMVRFVQEWLPQMEHEPPAAALARAQAWLRHVTNKELALWQSRIPTSAGAKPLLQSGSKRRHPEQTVTGISATRWELMPVRGRSARYTGSDAQLIVRIGAENNKPSDRPYTDPYYLGWFSGDWLVIWQQVSWNRPQTRASCAAIMVFNNLKAGIRISFPPLTNARDWTMEPPAGTRQR